MKKLTLAIILVLSAIGNHAQELGTHKVSPVVETMPAPSVFHIYLLMGSVGFLHAQKRYGFIFA